MQCLGNKRADLIFIQRSCEGPMRIGFEAIKAKGTGLLIRHYNDVGPAGVSSQQIKQLKTLGLFRLRRNRIRDDNVICPVANFSVASPMLRTHPQRQDVLKTVF